jgi:hypothetical protein
LEQTAMTIGGGARRRRTVVTSAAALCTTLVVAALLSIFGLAQVLDGAKVVLLCLFVLMCVTLAIFALLVAVSSLAPLRRRAFGDWL